MDLDLMWAAFHKYEPMLQEMLPQWLATKMPINVDVPAVMPLTAAVGDTLTVTMGNWENEPESYTYQWMSEDAPVVGMGDAYIVAETDAGHGITCVVTATNSYGSVPAPPSNAVAIPNGATRGAREAPAEPVHRPGQAPTTRPR